MKLLKSIFTFFEPVTKLVDVVHTSEEEKLQLKAAFLELQNELTVKFLDFQTKLVEAKSRVITAEAQGHSWMQRNWRPITMLTFLILIILDLFGLTQHRLPEQAWTLLQLGLGGYVIGRSAEKITPQILESIKKQHD